MGRGSAWPPNSFSEWVVGQNYKSRLPSCAAIKKSKLRVELSEGEDAGDDVLEITYPRGRRRDSTVIVKKKALVAASGKKVRFNSSRRSRKSALKKSSSSDSDTLVDASEDSDVSDIDTSDIQASDIDTSDIETFDDEMPALKRNTKLKQGKVTSCRKKAASSSAEDDALPHPTCKCDRCVQGRKILHAVIEFEAKIKAADEAKAAEETQAAENQVKAKGKGKKKGKKVTITSDTDGDTSDGLTTEDDEVPKGKKNKKKKQKPARPVNKPKPAVAATKKVVDKTVFKLPEVDAKMKPKFLMSPVAKVIQVEHAIETQYDPKPNAFYDNGKAIARVYHGPRYGNHTGTLYGDYPKKSPRPVPAAAPRTSPVASPGWVHYPYPYPQPPMAQTPWPRHPQHGAPPVPMGHQPHGRGPAVQGVGLSGYPPPSMPFDYTQMRNTREKPATDKASKNANVGWGQNPEFNRWDSSQKPASNAGWGEQKATSNAGWGGQKAASNAAWDEQKQASDSGSRKRDNAWGKHTTKSRSPSQNPGPSPADPFQDKSSWEGGAHAASWGMGDAWSDKNNVASPYKFNFDSPGLGSFQRTKAEKAERRAEPHRTGTTGEGIMGMAISTMAVGARAMKTSRIGAHQETRAPFQETVEEIIGTITRTTTMATAKATRPGRSKAMVPMPEDMVGENTKTQATTAGASQANQAGSLVATSTGQALGHGLHYQVPSQAQDTPLRLTATPAETTTIATGVQTTTASTIIPPISTMADVALAVVRTTATIAWILGSKDPTGINRAAPDPQATASILITKQESNLDQTTGLTNHQTKQQAHRKPPIGNTPMQPKTPPEQPVAGRPGNMDPGGCNISEIADLGIRTEEIKCGCGLGA